MEQNELPQTGEQVQAKPMEAPKTAPSLTMEELLRQLAEAITECER